MPSSGFSALRRKLDDLGYYQALVPESIPLVEALLHDLLATTHNLKVCKEQKYFSSQGSSSEEQRPPPPATSTPILVSRQSTTSQDAAKIASLESKVSDLELLNSECLSVIRNLQKDVEDRSKKILKLELAGNRAKIITHHDKPIVIETARPKIEMTSLVTSKHSSSSHGSTSSSPCSTSSSKSSADLNLIAMYEKRNEQLDQDLQRLQQELERAKEILSEVDKHWNNGAPLDLQISGKNDQMQSSYMVKLVKDNAALKEQLAAIEQHTRICFHGKRVLEPSTVCCCGQKICCYQGGGSCNDDIREAVEKSHIELHNQCLKNQLKSKQSAGCTGTADALKSHHHLELQHKQLHQLQDELRKNQEENREMSRRIVELSKVNESLKDKLRQMSEQQKILLSSCNGGKVGELIGYIERQRDIYRRNVEELLDKLDPDRRKIGVELEPDKENLPEGFAGFTQKPKFILKSKVSHGSRAGEVEVIKNVVEPEEKRGAKKVAFEHDKSYSPSAYKSSSVDSSSTSPSSTLSSTNTPEAVSLRDRCNHLEEEIETMRDKIQEMSSSKVDLEARLVDENSQLREELSRLRDEVVRLETASQEHQRKSRDQVSELRNETDSAWSQFQNDLRAYQREVESLRADLQLKEGHMLQLSRERDVLHGQLDERAIEVQTLRRSVQDATSRAEQSEVQKSSQDKSLNQCILEIQHLKTRLSEMERETQSLRERVETEKSLNREILTESHKLKSELQRAAEEKTKSEGQVEDLRSHIQRYVNEVKRIEELLALREKERMELLDQYKHLADEVDSAETYGRKLESQVSQLRLELSTRTAELQASELRLENMEKDLVEISLSNENYRAQVARLSSKVDIAESELRSMRSHSTWITSDLTDVHQLAEQLESQKLELQCQLNDQAREIESQNEEIRNLRTEINQLSQMIETERRKSAELERRMAERRMSTGGGRLEAEEEEEGGRQR